MIQRLTATIACILVATNAPAISPGSVPAGNQLYLPIISGTGSLFRELFTGAASPCEPGSIDVFVDDPSAVDFLNDAADFFSVACLGASSAGALAGAPLLFSSQSQLNDTDLNRAVARGTAVAFLATGAEACTGSVAVPAAGGRLAYTLNTGCAGRANQAPEAAVSRLDPGLSLLLTAADQAALTAQPLFDVVFAPAVSENLYRQLQLAQGLIPDDLEDNVPSLTTSQLHRIFSGEAFTWDEFTDASGGSFLTGEDIYICRRGNSQPTQGIFDAALLYGRCNVSVASFIQPDDLSCLASGCTYTRGGADAAEFIFAGQATSDVSACLDEHNDLGDHAIGILTTNLAIGGADQQYRFLGIDGAPPTLQSVANGDYDLFAAVLLIEGLTSGTAVQQAALGYVRENYATVGVIAASNATIVRNPGGDHGLLAAPQSASTFTSVTPNAAPVTEAAMRVNPVNGQVRTLTGTYNFCHPPTAAFGAQAVGGTR